MSMFSAAIIVVLSVASGHAAFLPEFYGDLFRLDIVHYNDFHDRFEESSIIYPVCQKNNDTCVGGFARLYHVIHKLLDEKPGSLLLNAGDSFQGTYWYSLLKWNITQQFLNLLPHDAFAVGNHEFDDGVEGLAPFLAALKAPVLAANMNVSNAPAMAELFKPHIILERNGRQIGIIGLITTETEYTSSADGVIFTDPIKAVKDEATKLTEYGVDIIIVLSHCGLDIDKQIAEEVGNNIDIIVGGHSHSLLWNGTAPSGEMISGPYPIVIYPKDKPHHKVLIVTASAFTKYVGNLTVWLDGNGEIRAYDGRPVFLNQSIPEDKEIKAMLQPYADKLHSVVEEVVGETSDDLLFKNCAIKECALGDIIAESLLEAVRNRQASNLTQVAFLLRNNIRGSISKGHITRAALINTVPFTNKIMIFKIKGIYLKELFEHCVTKFWVEKPFIGPWMPQIAGLKLTYNTTNVIGNRVQTILIKEDDEYKPIVKDKIYEVVTYDFIARGGNYFKMLKENAYDNKIIGTDVEVLENYIKSHSPLSANLDGRLTVLN